MFSHISVPRVLVSFSIIPSLYGSSSIVRVIEFRRLKWKGHLAKMEDCMSAFKILIGNPIEMRPSRRPRRDRRAILEWILNN